jgi:glycosyltransferase involved in cell wall biosynthesis
MTTDKKIAIFIVAYNAASTLTQVLERIPDKVMDLITEIFVIDDHSTDDTYSTGNNYKPIQLAIIINPLKV